MGAEAMTLDFSVELGAQDVALAELEANRAVWRDLPVIRYSPRAMSWRTCPTAARRS